jgi:hypothetical protein
MKRNRNEKGGEKENHEERGENIVKEWEQENKKSEEKTKKEDKKKRIDVRPFTVRETIISYSFFTDRYLRLIFNDTLLTTEATKHWTRCEDRQEWRTGKDLEGDCRQLIESAIQTITRSAWEQPRKSHWG